MAYTIQLAENGHANDYPFINYTGTNIPANYLVQPDTTYYLGPVPTPVGSADGIGIQLPSGLGVRCIGLTLVVGYANSAGAGYPGEPCRVRCFGPQAVGIATAAIAVNAQVEADSATAGLVKTYTSAAVVLGIALTQATAAQDQILIMLSAGQVAV